LRSNKNVADEVFIYLNDLLEECYSLHKTNHKHYIWSTICSIYDHKYCKDNAINYIQMITEIKESKTNDIDCYKIPLLMLEELTGAKLHK